MMQRIYPSASYFKICDLGSSMEDSLRSQCSHTSMQYEELQIHNSDPDSQIVKRLNGKYFLQKPVKQ